MNAEEFFYVLPYLFSLALTLALFSYAWRHRHVRGAKIYSLFAAGQTLTILGFILELISPNLATKILWDKFQWVTDFCLVFPPFLIFAIEFSEYKPRYPRIFWGTIITIIASFILLLLTDNIHHLLYPDPHLSNDYPFPELEYSFTSVVYFYAILYGYVGNSYGIGLLLKRAIQPHNVYRSQFLILAAGFSIPLVLSVFTFFNIRITPQRDNAPFALAVGNLLVAWGLFRHRLFSIAPIARERIVENMIDPVIVLDPQNRIVDINQTALAFMGRQSSDVIGRPSKEIFARWPAVMDMLENPAEQHQEVPVKSKGEISYFDISVSQMLNRRREMIGRIVVARDITRHKNLEMNYRALSQELEERVHERTEELRASAERYRAVVENQTEFIIRWKPDRTRTFVNDAYCRYFGLTHEQAMQTDFLTLIAEEDRPRVMEKIERLTSGETGIETEIHRVPRPDGSFGWQEWTDRAIRDERGVVIEFQSIGRDITQRKLAEEALRESEAIYRKAIEVAGAVPYLQSYSPDFTDIHYDFIGDGIRQLVGCSPEEFTTELWDSLVLESRLLDDLAPYDWKEAARRVRLGLNPVWKCEHRIQALDGTVRWVFESGVELRDASGISHGSVGLFQDITTRKKAEEELRKSEEKFSKAFQASPIIIAIFGIEHARIIEVNDTFEKLSGYSRLEIIGKTTLQLGLWANPADRDRIFLHLTSAGKVTNEEIQFQMKNGRRITGLFSAEVIELDGELCGICVIEDITERKKAEERILRLNRLYVTISQINQTIVHAPNKEMLLREICRVAIENGQFRMAWIGLIGSEGTVRPSAFAGNEQSYLTNLSVNYRDEITGPGPTETAIREERCIICRDIANDPRMRRWREDALRRGYRSSAAVPLREHGQVIGALTVYASEVDGFDSEDEELLEQIGLDVSFALDSLEAEHKRQIAESNLALAYETTLEGWSRALELRDKETEGHSRRVTETTQIVARAMHFDEDALIDIRYGSLLHDIGKMGIPDEILFKNGALTVEERELIQKHPTTAYELLKGIPYLKQALEIPYSHHEKWDGSGYPRGLKGEEIPLSARIFAVVDVWDALSNDRPYRAAWSQEKVVEYLLNESGKHFDPAVLDLFLNLLREGKIITAENR